MRAFKAIIDNGKVTLLEPAELAGRHEALIVVGDEVSPGDAEWARILRDNASRPALDKFLRGAEEEMGSGAAERLDRDRL